MRAPPTGVSDIPKKKKRNCFALSRKNKIQRNVDRDIRDTLQVSIGRKMT